MYSKLALVVVSLLAASVATAQDAEPPAKIKHKAIASVDTRPVSRDEARTVFSQCRHALGHALEAAIPEVSRIPSGAAPVTREEVVAELSDEWNLIGPKAKFAPLPESIVPGDLKIAPASRGALKRLIVLGFVGKVAPLATGPSDGLTPAQLGDAVGFFICRVAQLTHMPDPRWSPSLQNPSGS